MSKFAAGKKYMRAETAGRWGHSPWAIRPAGGEAGLQRLAGPRARRDEARGKAGPGTRSGSNDD